MNKKEWCYEKYVKSNLFCNDERVKIGDKRVADHLPFCPALVSRLLTMFPAFQFGSEHSMSLQIVL